MRLNIFVCSFYCMDVIPFYIFFIFCLSLLNFNRKRNKFLFILLPCDIKLTQKVKNELWSKDFLILLLV
jgi:hypothetical protein